MVIAITGATGFLGSHCAANAFRRGHSVRLIVRNVKKTNTAMSMHGLNSRDFEIVEAY